MKTLKQYPSQNETKAFHKGWGRSLACQIHFLRNHSTIELSEEDKEKLVDYMEKNRLRQFKPIKSNIRKKQK